MTFVLTLALIYLRILGYNGRQQIVAAVTMDHMNDRMKKIELDTVEFKRESRKMNQIVEKLEKHVDAGLALPLPRVRTPDCFAVDLEGEGLCVQLTSTIHLE